MQIIGVIDKQDVEEITFIAKMFLVGQRAQHLANEVKEEKCKLLE